jgi:hypothetical protein
VRYFVAAYLVFWAALFGYLIGLVRRQGRLVERSARLVATLAGRSAGSPSGGNDSEEQGS